MRIIIATCASGGHIFPALSLAQRLKQDNFQIYFVADRGRIENKIIENGFLLEPLSATKIDFKSPASFIKAIFKLIKSFFESVAILKKISPDAVVGFGGYASFPMVFAAYLNRIPTIIHEQNAIAGKANRIAAAFAKRVAISFPETKKYFNSKKVILTGCPVRDELFKVKKEDALKELKLNAGKFTILVMGGSQGSRRINQAFVEAILATEDLSQLQIIHITGQNDFDYVKKAFSKISIDTCCIAFLEKMGYAYSMADLVISRAGASTLSEIISFRIPSILIPYPFAYNHQMANALILARNGASIIIEDKDLTAEKLKKVILRLLKEKSSLKAMKESFNRIALLDAAKNLKEAVLAII